MQEIRTMRHLQLQRQGTTSTFLKPHAPYSLRPAEGTVFRQTVSSIRTPSGYISSGLSKHFGQKKFQGLKSHDHHVLLQQIIPACIRSFLEPGPRDAIIRMGHVFRRLCAKVVDPSDMDNLDTYTAETLCLMEMYFPPAFFDSMPHLVVHLPYQLRWCGPVHSRWCYGIERFLFHLKGYIKNRARPEACIANGHLYSEALGFITEHLVLDSQARRIWNMEEDERDGGEVLEGKGRPRTLSDMELQQIHDFIIENTECTTIYHRYKNVLCNLVNYLLLLFY